MKFLIICAFILAIVFGSNANEIKSPKTVVRAVKPRGRITPAYKAYPGKIPHQVSLGISTRNESIHWCSGTLISHTVILTAAHCTEGAVEVIVILGSTIRARGGLKYVVTESDILIHPEWNNKTWANDISIIRIPYTKYSRNIRAIKLPSKASGDNNLVGRLALASSWRRKIDASPITSDHLEYDFFEIMPSVTCKKTYNVFSNYICVSNNRHVSTCADDLGGPLTYSKTLIGIASLRHPKGCKTGMPEVFTSVSSYMDWIESNSNVRSEIDDIYSI